MFAFLPAQQTMVIPLIRKFPVPLLKILSSNFKHYSTTVKTVKELEMPVPFGKITAKAWGSDKAYPVLVFHGWLDNCGTFDKLMPLLSDNFYYVTLDAAGHGCSSHYPPGQMYSDLSMVMDFKKVVDHLGWQKFHVLGHSFGGALGLMFSAIFTDLVDKLMLLDIVKPFSLPADNTAKEKIKGLLEFVNLENKIKKSAPQYTMESARTRLVRAMHDEITEEGARFLLKRGTRSVDGENVIFSRDLRCTNVEYISVRSHDTVKHLMSNLQCKLLIILANNTHPLYNIEQPGVILRFLELYKKVLKVFELQYVDGNHFVHLNNPERVAPIINEFLLTKHD